MQSRAFIHSPQVCRIVKAPAAARSMSLFSGPSFVPRFPASPFVSLEREIAPFFRLMDDFSRTFDHIVPATNSRTQPTPFQPRFDVREVRSAYELRGELPGVDSNNIEVEFTDGQTLVIRGRTEAEMTSDTTPAEVQQQQQQPAAVEAAESTTTNAVSDDAASTHSTSSYQKATVEDEATAETATSTPGHATPAESVVLAEASNEEPQQQEQQSQVQAASQPRYWISERHSGSFQRVFNFPTKINQEAVKASLKNGILSVVVPKAVALAPRKIVVQ